MLRLAWFNSIQKEVGKPEEILHEQAVTKRQPKGVTVDVL
jgi:hypothetical protein